MIQKTIRLNQLFIALFIAFIGSFYATFYVYFAQEQQNKSEILSHEIHFNLNEIGYYINHDLNRWEDIKDYQALLDRKAAQNHLIKNLYIGHGNQLLLSTKRNVQHLPNKPLHTEHEQISKTTLSSTTIHKHEFTAYINGQEKQLDLYLEPNQKAIASYFQTLKNEYIFYLLVPTLLIAVLIHAFISIMLLNPLKQLKTFAKDPSKEVGDHYRVKELQQIHQAIQTTHDTLQSEVAQQAKTARQDNLTGLSNRLGFQEYINTLIHEQNKAPFSLLFIDLDNFKNVNDTLGHDLGDDLLVEIGTKLTEQNPYGLNARIGGDEFLMIIPHRADKYLVNHFVIPILDKIHNIQEIFGHPIAISSSIGIAQYPQDGRNHNELMKNADIALFEAKRHGKNRYWHYDNSLHLEVQERVQLENTLKKAMEYNELFVLYQPQTEVKSNTIVGVESLIRWQHPEMGLIPPFKFIPIAEQSGMIREIGDWVLETSIRQLQHWNSQGLTLNMSVNVSSIQLRQPNFVQRVSELIAIYQISSSNLHLEITESVMMENYEQNKQTLEQLNQLGVKIALDDFGTGYSSMAYLRDFPIHILKIDKSFIDAIEDKDGAIFVKTIINMAQTLGLEIVSEGVEHESQRQLLQQMRCDVYQGYLCSRPINPHELAEKLL